MFLRIRYRPRTREKPCYIHSFITLLLSSIKFPVQVNITRRLMINATLFSFRRWLQNPSSACVSRDSWLGNQFWERLAVTTETSTSYQLFRLLHFLNNKILHAPKDGHIEKSVVVYNNLIAINQTNGARRKTKVSVYKAGTNRALTLFELTWIARK